MWHNPRETLPSSIHVAVFTFSGDGAYWGCVGFFSPEIAQLYGKSTLSAADIARIDQTLYGGLWASWKDQASFDQGDAPGRVEYMAAVSGYGPDVLEWSAEALGRDLVIGPQAVEASKTLFGRYGGMVRPEGKEFPFQLVRGQQAHAEGLQTVRLVAANAYNRVGVRALPRR